MKPTPKAIENAARAMLASVKWSSFWSPDDARALAKAALSADLGDMVLVPKEASWEMQIAGRDAILAEDSDLDLSTDDARECYRAMIAAAEGER